MKALSVVHAFFCALCVVAPALAADAVCHRVSEGNEARVYCGSARQWAELRTRVGFRCRREGKKNELCATASEWKRMGLSASTKRALDANTKEAIDQFSERKRQPENLTPMTGGPNVNAPMQGD
ncbi:MAG TPA: hypothetical protein VN645_14565 [Steroidobacteraceae bacterium]|nr:hypothetical protein [Steroidobacteraceae bacterium]